ncbi:MAG: GGDEF domain-containing protein, partial [Oceanospirillum sp.]|nr:GGDEF domain-containing protein [Oceanospirillum sp.]
KFNGVAKWTWGDEDRGLGLFFSGYSADWDATDQIARRAVREGLIGRLGGDEFLIILDETNPEAVSDAARQILKAVNGIDIKDPAGEPIAASVSIGCALSAEGMTLIDLIGKADDGLYTAKEAGRGRWYLSG